MGAYQEDSRLDGKGVVVTVEPLVEPDQLSKEGHVGVGNLSLLPDQVEGLLLSHFLGEDEVAEYASGRPGDALNAVDEDPAILTLNGLKEVDHLIEDGLDVLSNMVLQVQRKVSDVSIGVIVGTEVSSAVEHMGDSVCLQLLVVLRHIVAAEVDEAWYNFRANEVEHDVLILLPGGALVVKLLIEVSLRLCVVVSRNGDVASQLIFQISSSLEGRWLVSLAGKAERLAKTSERQAHSWLLLNWFFFDVLYNR